MGRLGGAAGGAATGAKIGSVIPGIGTAIGGVIGGGLGFLFGGDDDPKGYDEDNPEHQFRNLLRMSAGNLRRDATGSKRMGQAVTTPAVNYLTDVLSSNPAAILDATRQERGRVIDQYDTARRAIANFGPRGGGTTSTLAESRFDQAESLADITSSARRDAVSAAGDLGTRLTALGLTADQLASADINAVIRAILAREGVGVQGQYLGLEKGEGTGELIGEILGGIFKDGDD
jgi:hypothetical protein